MAPKRTCEGVSAWLVTWEHQGNHAKPARHVAAIYNSRWGSERVRELVELIYVTTCYEISEQIMYATNKRAFNPYPAEFISLNGISWQGAIHCGHNPSLYARLVNNLRTEAFGDGEERVLWDERPKPKHRPL